jgi:hypothetical protein
VQKAFFRILVSITVASTAIIPTYAASPKPGTACSKVNQSITSTGLKFTCVKNGKKLVWSKGEKVTGLSSRITDPEPSSRSKAPTVDVPAATPTPVPSASSTPVFKAPEAPSNFQDLSTHLSGIIYGSWAKAATQINQSSFSIDNLHFLIGPNTTLNSLDAHYKSAIENVTKLYSNVPQAKNVYLIYYNSKDIDWAQSQFEKYMDATYGYGNRSTAAKDNCNPPDCNGGMAVHTNNFDAIILMGDSNGWVNFPWNPNQGYMGHGFAHEYTHTVQVANMNPNWGNFPPWLTEGVAEWSATTAVNSGNYDDYIKFRTYQDLGMQFEQPNVYTEEYITKILNPNQTFAPGEDIGSYLRNYPHWDAYSIGMMTSETLVALKGPDSLMNILHYIGAGMTFPQAFEKEFDTPWATAAPLIAHALSLEIQQKVMR